MGATPYVAGAAAPDDGFDRFPTEGANREPLDDRRSPAFTRDGYEQRSRELEHLRTHERPRLSDLLYEARAEGALDDKPTLVELLDKQAQLERRIATLEANLAHESGRQYRSRRPRPGGNRCRLRACLGRGR